MSAVMISMAVLILYHKGCTYGAPVRYVTKTWSVDLLNKKTYTAAAGRSPAEIVGSNPTGGMDIFLL